MARHSYFIAVQHGCFGIVAYILYKQTSKTGPNALTLEILVMIRMCI
jgi:hypothetical protein